MVGKQVVDTPWRGVFGDYRELPDLAVVAGPVHAFVVRRGQESRNILLSWSANIWSFARDDNSL